MTNARNCDAVVKKEVTWAVLYGRIRPEIIGKIRKILGGNTASMFQIFPVFSCRIQ
jgi:hypothetical protein